MKRNQRTIRGKKTVPLNLSVLPEERAAIYELAAQSQLSVVQLMLMGFTFYYRHLGTGDALINQLICRDPKLYQDVLEHARERAAAERAAVSLEFPEKKEGKEHTQSGRPPPVRPGRTGS